MMSGWELLEHGQYDEAIVRLSEEVASDPNDLNIANLGFAYLLSDDCERAKEVFDGLIQRNPKYMDGHYILAGIARWLLGDPVDAIGVWKEGLDCAYGDWAGGIDVPLHLYFGAVREPTSFELTQAEGLLAKRLRDGGSGNWPGPIARFLLGQIDEAKLRRVAKSKHAHIECEQIAQLEFYIGVARYHDGDHRAYVSHMERCAVTKSLTVDELLLARYEVLRAKSSTNTTGSRRRK